MDIFTVRTRDTIIARFQRICTLSVANPNIGGGNAGIDLVEHHRRGALCIVKEFPVRDLPRTALHELYVTRHLSGSENTIDYWDYYLETAMSPPGGALITGFCKYGNLEELITRYQQHGRTFPEAFIWHVFFSLAKALVHLDHGSDPDRDWNWVVHQDIWPANVFLTEGSTSYPRVVLGDFGSSITRDDLRSSNIYPLRQQPDFAPLSQTWAIVDSRNDVCQVGLVMVALCRTTFHPRVYRDEFETTPAGPSYSSLLNEVISPCLEPELEERPTARELLEQLTRAARRLRVSENRTIHVQEGYVDEWGSFARRDVHMVG